MSRLGHQILFDEKINSNEKKNFNEKENFNEKKTRKKIISIKNVVVSSQKFHWDATKLLILLIIKTKDHQQPLPNQNRTFLVDRNFADITQLCRLHGHGRFPVNEGETINVFYLPNVQFVCVGLDNDGN